MYSSSAPTLKLHSQQNILDNIIVSASVFILLKFDLAFFSTLKIFAALRAEFSFHNDNIRWFVFICFHSPKSDLAIFEKIARLPSKKKQWYPPVIKT